MIEPFYEHAGITVYHGDCEEVLKQIPDNSIDSGVCDPPYGIRFLSQNWDYDVPKVAIWEEVLRTLKPGAHLTAFAGTRTQHRMAVNIEDAGFQIRDMICELVDTNPYFEAFVSTLSQEQLKMFAKFASVDGMLGWGQGQGFSKSRDISKAIDKEQGKEREVIGKKADWQKYNRNDYQGSNVDILQGSRTGKREQASQITAPATPEAEQWEGWGTQLKPSIEPITLARKPISEKTIAANVLRWGTGAINIDGCRIDREPIPAFVNGVDRERNRSSYDTGGSNRTGETTTKGGFPSNVIVDGSEAVTALFPDTSDNKRPNTEGKPYKISNGIFDLPTQGHSSGYSGSGSASRYFYTAKPSPKEREGNSHFTVKPLSLMVYLCRLCTPPGGLILDPFGGSGTTAVAAIRGGFKCIIIEQDEGYCKIIRERVIEELMRTGEAAAADGVETKKKSYQIGMGI